MKNDKKIEPDKNKNMWKLATPESTLEKGVDLIVDWASMTVGLGCVILCLPLFCIIDIYRWFKFKVLRRN